jgi:hypothetical protein
LGNRAAPEEWAAVLEAAIQRVTRAVVSADDEVLVELVAERRAMREELEELRRGEGEKVVPAWPMGTKRTGAAFEPSR